MSSEISVEKFPWRTPLLALKRFGVLVSVLGDLGMFYMARAELEGVENTNITNEKLFVIAGALSLAGILLADYSEYQIECEKYDVSDDTSAMILAAKPDSGAIPYPTQTEDLHLFMPPESQDFTELG